MNAAETKAASPEYYKADLSLRGDNAVERAIAHASEKLGERQSVFSTGDLQQEAGRVGFGKVSYEQIIHGIDDATKQGGLLPCTYRMRSGK